MRWYLRACPVCSGDLHEDIEDRAWATCFLCARSFKVSEVLPATSAEAAREAATPSEAELPSAA